MPTLTPAQLGALAVKYSNLGNGAAAAAFAREAASETGLLRPAPIPPAVLTCKQLPSWDYKHRCNANDVCATYAPVFRGFGECYTCGHSKACHA